MQAQKPDPSGPPATTLPDPARGHLIPAADWQHVKFAWLDAVRADPDLTDFAKLLAHELALTYANGTSLRCDPSLAELERRSGKSRDTVKRAIAALIEGGWIVRKPGLGRGHSSVYGFVSRGVVITLKGGRNARPKGGSAAPYSGSVKGGIRASEKGAFLPTRTMEGTMGARAGTHAHTRGGANPATPDRDLADATAWTEWLENASDAEARQFPPHARVLRRAIAEKLITEDRARALGLLPREQDDA